MSDTTSRRKEVLEKRLRSELEDVRTANMKGIWDIQVDETNVWKWILLILSDRVPYNKGSFKVEINIPANVYPFKPPTILFLTQIYHPNVDEEGYIHLEILSKYWSPATQMEQVLRCLLAVINEPTPVKSKISKFSEKRPDYSYQAVPQEVGKIASRLRKELQQLRKANIKGIKNIQVNDIWRWTGILMPDHPPYNKGAYRFEITIPPEYPRKAPELFFRTKIYHPNVYDSGRIDMRETCVGWSSQTKMVYIFQALFKLVNEPDPDHFPPSKVNEMYFKDREQFFRTAEEFAKEFAEKISSDEFREPEGKCLPFVATCGQIDGSSGAALEEGKCLEIKYPSTKEEIPNNTEKYGK